MAAFMSVLRLQQDLVAAAHQTLRKYDLSITEHAALIHLAFAPGHRETLGRIAEQLLIGAGRCNYVIKDLEAKGLVRRRPHPSDGRVTLAILSAKGRKVVAACSEAQARNNFGFGDLDSAELDQLVALVTRARWASARKQVD
jgi:DNA-binding MarR family transcriptional regulator